MQDDEDRSTWVRTLGEGCERTGFRVHAYVLMTNHLSLAAGDEGGQPFARRRLAAERFHAADNTRHRLWGHVFGGRDKSDLG